MLDTSLLRNAVGISRIKGEKIFLMATVVERYLWVSLSSAHSMGLLYRQSSSGLLKAQALTLFRFHGFVH